mgnify:CR=1 FL=1
MIGSSPLSRGILGKLCRVDCSFRIIPALAGNTLSTRNTRWGTRDHPRSRGEYHGIPAAADHQQGSSPLSRGILLRSCRSFFFVRIIPALAGNTSSVAPIAVDGQDHPRSRGEYNPLVYVIMHLLGSSPLSRGIPDRACVRGALSRIIPALAGNTANAVRIENPYMGSSPLSRGILVAAAHEVVKLRIIPALAGNTRSPTPWGCMRTDHPRSRGEYRGARIRGAHTLGSSPLSRGIH